MAIVPRAAPLRIGSITIQPVSDGTLWLDPSSIFKDAQPEEWRPYGALDVQGRAELALSYHLPFPGIGRVSDGGWDGISG